MLNMSITIKELNDKHQLNPNNKGIYPIDQCMCLTNEELGICGLLGITIFSDEYLYLIEWDGGHMFIPDSALIMKADKTFGSIKDNTLHPADSILLVNANGEKSFVHITEIRFTEKRNLVYRIKTQRGNYILNNGVVLKAD